MEDENWERTLFAIRGKRADHIDRNGLAHLVFGSMSVEASGGSGSVDIILQETLHLEWRTSDRSLEPRASVLVQVREDDVAQRVVVREHNGEITAS